jgi:hypothetical protein
LSNDIQVALERMRAWGEARDWRGYDPYDALNSPLAPLLTLRTRSGRRALTQAVKRSPVNLRPLLGIKPDWNAKAIGLVASGYLGMAATGDESAEHHAERWLEWLVSNSSGDEGGLAWGYHFDVQTRFFFYPRGTPNTIATSFVTHALLDGLELLKEERWGHAALSACRFLTTNMYAQKLEQRYFRYLPDDDQLVHNANLLACAVLARAGTLLGDDGLVEPARRALASSLGAQREDGSWPYADGPKGDWVDNFHTGYVLESLAGCAHLDAGVKEKVERGLEFWQRELFLEDGTPKYAPGRTYPLDAHCYATAIEAWLALSNWYPEALANAERIAGLLIDRMLDSSGFVRFQQHRLWTSRVPLVRWSTAPSFRALAVLLLARARRFATDKVHARLD